MFLKRRLIHLAKVVKAFVMHDGFDRHQTLSMRSGFHRVLKGSVGLDRLQGDQFFGFILNAN
jgi:hypothetical protein